MNNDDGLVYCSRCGQEIPDPTLDDLFTIGEEEIKFFICPTCIDELNLSNLL